MDEKFAFPSSFSEGKEKITQKGSKEFIEKIIF